MIAGDNILLSS